MKKEAKQLSIPNDESETLISVGGEASDACVGVRPETVASSGGCEQRVKLIISCPPSVITLTLSQQQTRKVAALLGEVSDCNSD